MKFWKETVLVDRGYGLYECREYNGDKFDSRDNILSEGIGQLRETYLLGEDTLPEGVEDIRGNIIDEPDEVWASVEDGQPTRYYGIKEFVE